MLYRLFIVIYQKTKHIMRNYILLLLLLSSASIQAQVSGTLSYQQAVAIALKSNYDIELAQNKTEIATEQNTYGNAGFMPKIDLVAGATIASNKTKQEFSSGLNVNKSGVGSQNKNAGIVLSWTIFDGLKMFATKERLNLLEQQSQLGLKIQLEQTIEQVTQLYYSIVKQQQVIKGIEAAMEVSSERIKIAQKKSETGAGSNVELLQAKLDFNAQRSNLISQKNLLVEYKSNLLLQLKTDPSSVFDVEQNVAFEPVQTIDAIKQKIETQNQSLAYSKKYSLIQTQVVKEAKSLQMPRLALTSGYNFVRSENAAGFSLLNQNLGYNVGLTLNWNIFNGFTTQTQINVAQLQLQQTKIETDYLKTTLLNASTVAYLRWEGANEILTLEEENNTLAEEQLKIVTERLKLGLGNYLEIKESQSSYEEAVTRLANARYNSKIAETTLKKLSGELVK